MNRLERLVNLVAALLGSRRPLTRAQILERVPGYGQGEAARRAFERDKDALREMGIPLVMEPLDRDHEVQGEGYRIPPEKYRLADPHLAPDELAALELAASTVRLGAGGDAAGLSEAGMAIWKFGGATVAAGAVAPMAALPGSEHLPALFSALGERAAVRFRYKGATRHVDPYRLSCGGGHWYLAGYDHDRGEQRSFRLDRMGSAPVAGAPDAFERPAGAVTAPRPDPWRMGDEDEVEALVLVDAGQAGRAEARTGAGTVRERRPDGSIVLALDVTNRGALRTFVLDFLDHAEVLAPPALRDDMVSWLGAIAAGAGS